jgi:serine/threonine protein kinase
MSDMQELARQLAPEFEVTRVLGTGAMGTVYLAREVALRRLVAIKVPLAELADDEQVLARFQREAHAAARIHHRGACTLHRIGTLENGTPYLVMEYVEGKTLDDVLAAGGTFDVDTARSILEQVSGALAAAHAVGVVHRDIRPGNVIWDAATRRAVLTDFGIAGILETGSEAVTRITRMGQTLGQVGFSSPEQLLGETVTAATDVYSLGVLAHHVLTGQGPYDVKSKIEVVQAHVKGEARPLRQVRADVDPRVEDTVLRCLAKTPSQRPEAQAVERILSEVRAGPTGPATTGGHAAPGWRGGHRVHRGGLGDPLGNGDPSGHYQHSLRAVVHVPGDLAPGRVPGDPDLLLALRHHCRGCGEDPVPIPQVKPQGADRPSDRGRGHQPGHRRRPGMVDLDGLLTAPLVRLGPTGQRRAFAANAPTHARVSM